MHLVPGEFCGQVYPLIHEHLHSLEVGYLLLDVREVFVLDEFGAALSLAGVAELIIKPVLDGRVGFAETSGRAGFSLV
jgi:hypothetical protein